MVEALLKLKKNTSSVHKETHLLETKRLSALSSDLDEALNEIKTSKRSASRKKSKKQMLLKSRSSPLSALLRRKSCTKKKLARSIPFDRIESSQDKRSHPLVKYSTYLGEQSRIQFQMARSLCKKVSRKRSTLNYADLT